MNRTSIATSCALLLLSGITGAANAQSLGTSLATRWSTPSTLTPAQAAQVLADEASEREVSPSQLFEARKHLRTDGSLSLGGQVTSAMLQNLVADRFDTDVRVRILPIVLQWLESWVDLDSAGREVLHLKGESVGLITANADPNLAATMLMHFTIQENWRWCSTSLCVSPVASPLQSLIAYELAVPLRTTTPAEAHASGLLLASGFAGSMFRQEVPALDSSRYMGVACDPLPSSTWLSEADRPPAMMTFVHQAEQTEHSRTNRVLCGFFAIPEGTDSALTYRVGGTVARPPAAAARSAVINNPLQFTVFE